MTPKDIHNVEQAMESMKRNFCPAVHQMFMGFLAAGFSEEYAFELTKTWMIIVLSNNPPKEQ